MKGQSFLIDNVLQSRADKTLDVAPRRDAPTLLNLIAALDQFCSTAQPAQPQSCLEPLASLACYSSVTSAPLLTPCVRPLSATRTRSNRLTNVPCGVCGDQSSGKHYGIWACDGCSGFFKRSMRSNRQYQCKGNKSCSITAKLRNQCRYCRQVKCLEAGMLREAIQHDRGPRKKKSKPDFGSRLDTAPASVQGIQQLQDASLPRLDGAINELSISSSLGTACGVDMSDLLAQYAQRNAFALHSPAFFDEAAGEPGWLKQFTTIYAYYRNALGGVDKV